MLAMLQGEGVPVQEAAFAIDLPVRQALRPLADLSGSLAQKVYASLREAILSLSYRPGDVLRKPEICEVLGVSRSPVSEAVARLAGEHLVVVVPQAGTYVARLSMGEIREGAFLREALELAAVERVALAVTDEQLVQLQRSLRVQEALLRDGDVAGFYQTDARMHEMILSFTGFRRVASLADTSWVHVNRARQLILPQPGRIEDTLVEHQQIVAAIEARNVEGARGAVRVHLGKLIGFLEPLAQNRPDLFEPET